MTPLYVYINGYEVGEYTQRKGGGQEFTYSDTWLAQAEAIPVSLSMPLTEKKHRGDVVYNFFDNLLPDSQEIRNRIQTRVGAKTNQAFDLLTEIGRDCVGAIQLLTEKDTKNIKQITGTPLTEQNIASDLRNYKTIPLGINKEEEFRISIAGIQEKTGLLWHDDQWLRPGGATPTTHIVKLPIGRNEYTGIDLSMSVENEWLCLELLRSFNLPVPEATMQCFEDIKVIVVKRFDRELSKDKSWIIRKPVEDMCQANGVSAGLKYESNGGPGIDVIMTTLNSSIYPQADRRQFMKCVFIFWIMGAIDGHAKNFSIFLKRGGRFCLTPFYDVISAYPFAEKREIEYHDLKMAMALRSKNAHYHWHEIQPRHWFNQAKRVSFPDTEMQGIIDEVIDDLDHVIEHVSSILPGDFPNHVADPIFNGMRNCIKRIN